MCRFPYIQLISSCSHRYSSVTPYKLFTNMTHNIILPLSSLLACRADVFSRNERSFKIRPLRPPSSSPLESYFGSPQPSVSFIIEDGGILDYSSLAQQNTPALQATSLPAPAAITENRPPISACFILPFIMSTGHKNTCSTSFITL